MCEVSPERRCVSVTQKASNPPDRPPRGGAHPSDRDPTQQENRRAQHHRADRVPGRVAPVRGLMNAGRIPPLITAMSRMSSQIANAHIIIDVRYAMGVPRKLTITLAAPMTAQSLTGLMAPEQYRDVEWIKATWYGNDWLTLIVAVPLLLMSSVAARRGSPRAFLLWAGAVGYAVYNYAFYLLGAALNAFFPVYVVCVVLAAVMLILTLGNLDTAAMTLRARPAAPLSLIGGSFVIIGLGLAVVWTAIWAAHVFAGRPTPVDPEAFRLVAALDLSMMAPALVCGGVLLWRRRPWGVVLAAIAGVQGSLYLAVLLDQLADRD